MITGRPLAAAAAVLTLTLAACGGSDPEDASGDGIASLGTDADATTDSTIDSGAGAGSDAAGAADGVEAPTDPEEAFALYDQCLQDAGIDTTAFDPEAGGGVAVDGDVTDDGATPSEAAFEVDDESFAAFEDCEKHLANTDTGFDLSPEQQADLADAELAFARCMRDQGIDWPDPSPGDDGAFAVEFDEAEFDEEAMNSAFDECQPVFDDVFGELEGDGVSS